MHGCVTQHFDKELAALIELRSCNGFLIRNPSLRQVAQRIAAQLDSSHTALCAWKASACSSGGRISSCHTVFPVCRLPEHFPLFPFPQGNACPPAVTEFPPLPKAEFISGFMARHPASGSNLPTPLLTYDSRSLPEAIPLLTLSDSPLRASTGARHRSQRPRPSSLCLLCWA